MDKLKEWDALAAVAGTEHDHLLNTVATWHTDTNGTAHGHSDHASTSHTGTLRDLLEHARHGKGCCTVSAVAGPAGKQAAETAQQLTASNAHLARLTELARTHPDEAYRKALGELTRSTDPADTLALEQLRDHAKAHAQSTTQKTKLEAHWLERAARRHPDSPLATISRLLDGNIRIHTWHVRNTLLNVEMTDTWTSELLDMIAKVHPDGLDVLDELELDEILEHTTHGTPLKAAIVAAWRNKAEAAAREAHAWTRAWIAQRTGTGKTALVITDQTTWQYIAPDVHAAWSRHDLDDIALVLPIGIAEGLALALSGTTGHYKSELTWSPLAAPLSDSELDVVDRLAKDQNGQVDNIDELIEIARALARP